MKRNVQKEAYWRDMVERQARSGMSVRRFCAEQEISEASFYGWRKKLARRDQEKVAPNSRPQKLEAANSRQRSGVHSPGGGRFRARPWRLFIRSAIEFASRAR